MFVHYEEMFFMYIFANYPIVPNEYKSKVLKDDLF